MLKTGDKVIVKNLKPGEKYGNKTFWKAMKCIIGKEFCITYMSNNDITILNNVDGEWHVNEEMIERVDCNGTKQ